MPWQRMHRKVWLAWGRWWAIQIVWLPECSFGVHIEWQRPLVDVFLGIATIAIGNHPVLSDPRTRDAHSCRGFLFPEDVSGPVL
jgi:hypothetical protein